MSKATRGEILPPIDPGKPAPPEQSKVREVFKKKLDILNKRAPVGGDSMMMRRQEKFDLFVKQAELELRSKEGKLSVDFEDAFAQEINSVAGIGQEQNMAQLKADLAAIDTTFQQDMSDKLKRATRQIERQNMTPEERTADDIQQQRNRANREADIRQFARGARKKLTSGFSRLSNVQGRRTLLG